MPTPDQLFYRTLRASTPIRRNVAPVAAAAREDSRRRAVTPTATSSELRRSQALKRYDSPKVVRSTNITTTGYSASLHDNRFSGAETTYEETDQVTPAPGRSTPPLRSTPNFVGSATPTRGALVNRRGSAVPIQAGIAGRSLDGGVASVEERRHPHRWSATTHSADHDLHVATTTANATRREHRNARAVDSDYEEGLPKLQALERTLEAEMLELRRLTDSLEATMASVMSLEDQRKALARMVGRTRQHQQQQRQYPEATSSMRGVMDASINNTFASPTNSSSAAKRPTMLPTTPVATHQGHHTVGGVSPLTFVQEYQASNHNSPPRGQLRVASSTPKETRRSAGTDVDDSDDVTVLTFISQPISLSDSGKKKNAISAPLSPSRGTPTKFQTVNGYQAGDTNEDPLASSPILSQSNGRLLLSGGKSDVSKFDGGAQQELQDQFPVHQAADSDRTHLQTSPDDDMMVIDFTDYSDGTMRRKPQPHASYPIVARNGPQPLNLSNERSVPSAKQASLTTSPSGSPSTALSNFTQPPSEPNSFSSAAVLLSAQAHALRGDLLKYEEDLLLLQDELIRTQRGSDTVSAGHAVGEHEAEKALLMHLRLVLRDELSSCKARGQSLDSVAEQLIMAR